MLLDMSTSLIPQSNHGIMVEEEEEVVVEDLGSLLSPLEDSSSSSSSSSEEEDFMEDGTSSASSSSPPPASDDRRGQEGPLFDMSSLMTQLPLKRGLSRFYQGKSRSFTCMSSVRSLEDLVKPERRKSRSCGGNLDSQRSLLPKVCSKVISKKPSKGSFGGSISSRKHNSFMGSRPPIPPHRSNSISGQTLLFA